MSKKKIPIKNEYSSLLRRDLTDNQAAALRLRKALEFYPFGSVDVTNSLRDRISDLETLKYMNMNYLAGALYIYWMLGQRLPTPEDMQTNNEPMITVLRRIILESGKDTEKDIIKYKEVLLTYLVKIQMYLTSSGK